MRTLIPSIAIAALAFGGCTKKETPVEAPPVAVEQEAPPKSQPSSRTGEPIKPLPESVDVNMDKVLLGRRLFFDRKLSGDGKLSCATCHSLDHGGAEPRKSSLGINDQLGPINAPTVLNASFHIAQFWDGRAKDLQEQAAGPVANPIEMGAKWEDVVSNIAEDKNYASGFSALYKDGVTQANITDAIAEYEKSLITPSRFDDYLRGNDNAITAEELAGYQEFKKVGCTACHNGILVGGGMFQKMGLVNDYFADRGGEITEADLGRYNFTKNEADKHFFKVPTLRNVALTPPYFHDGSREKLEDAVKTMGKFQLGQELTDAQVASIVAFLKTLTGKLPAHARPDKT